MSVSKICFTLAEKEPSILEKDSTCAVCCDNLRYPSEDHKGLCVGHVVVLPSERQKDMHFLHVECFAAAYVKRDKCVLCQDRLFTQETANFNDSTKKIYRYLREKAELMEAGQGVISILREFTEVEDRGNAVIDAAYRGHVDALKCLLTREISVEDRGKAVRDAAYKGHVGALKCLLTEKITIKDRGKAVRNASLMGHAKALAILLEGGCSERDYKIAIKCARNSAVLREFQKKGKISTIGVCMAMLHATFNPIINRVINTDRIQFNQERLVSEALRVLALTQLAQHIFVMPRRARNARFLNANPLIFPLMSHSFPISFQREIFDQLSVFDKKFTINILLRSFFLAYENRLINNARTMDADRRNFNSKRKKLVSGALCISLFAQGVQLGCKIYNKICPSRKESDPQFVRAVTLGNAVWHFNILATNALLAYKNKLDRA